MNATTRDILDRALRREPFDERAAARWLLDELDRLERRGIIRNQYSARCRVARLASPDLRRELHLAAGLQLAGVAA